MKTLKKLTAGNLSIPADIAWNLAFVAEAKGNQMLGAQRPRQIIKTLTEQALIESTLASNRIDGIKIDKKRNNAVLYGAAKPKDRKEEVIRGYRLALDLINANSPGLGFSQATIKKLHKMIGGDGNYKKSTGSKVPTLMKDLVSLRQKQIKERRVHPVMVAIATCLDFICISPFSEANERLARLLLLLQLSQEGYLVGKYVSLEGLIEKKRTAYSRALKGAQQGWGSGKHDPWPFVGFVLDALKKAYTEFVKYSSRAKKVRSRKGLSKGEKTELVLNAVRKLKNDFTLAQLLAKCPEVNTEMVRKVLDILQREGNITLVGKGSGVRWMKKGKMLI